MASSAKHFSLFLLLTLLSSLQIHARDSQFFNKIPSTTNKNVVPIEKEAPKNQQQEDPNFLPENENGYGLYGHEAGQLPPSATKTTTATTTTTPLNTEPKQPVNKYLPKNYNPVAYVTVPEDMNDNTKFTKENNYNNENENNKYYNGEENNYNNQQQEEESQETEYRSNPATTTSTPNKNNVYYSGAATFRSRDRYPTNGGESNGFQPQGMSDTRFSGESTFNSRAYGGEPNGFQTLGMSDTRNLENGKYFYDVNTEKYSSTHPYESLKGVRAANLYNNNNNNRNYYGNNENSYEFNSENSINGGYQNQEEFQLDDNNAMP